MTLARRLAAHHRATRRARFQLLAFVVVFGAGGLWLVGRLSAGGEALLMAGGVLVVAAIAGLVVLRRNAAVRLAHVGDPPPPPVSYATLGRRFAQHHRFQQRLFFFLVIPFGAVLLLLPLVVPQLPASWFRGGRFFLLWFVSFLGVLMVAAWLERVRRTAVGLSCPQCGAALATVTAVALDAGCCPDCGVAIADLSPAPSDPRPAPSDSMPVPATPAEFSERVSRLEESSQGNYVVFIGLSVVIFFGALALLLARARNQGSPTATFALPLGGMVLALVVAVLGGQRWVVRARRLGLACPYCESLLAGTAARQVRAAGTCPTCHTPFWRAVEVVR